MRAPALGCISLVLCLLELPACLPLPDGRAPKRREPPDRRPSPASLLGEQPGPQPPAPPQPAGPRHKPLLPSRRPSGPRHKLLLPKLSPKLSPRHRPKLSPRHRPPLPRHSPKLGPRHEPPFSPRHGARLAPRHRLLIPRHHPKLIPRHHPKLIPRHHPKLPPHREPPFGPRPSAPVAPQHPRGRRHVLGRPQLLRVGCVLGTCQVQNLSHRLWQLMGQSGRQDSSPMNPNSPHSYG
ncbi:protein ADM2 [Patagioenas fasciata]|uniref:protein ADM2 n=1 Tax=Patagioenas fasciata TaxID=372321 RepID=UPI0032E93826